MLSWGIATIVLCSIYSSLVTSNVIAPKSLVSAWSEYKQLEKFTKVFGLNNQEKMSRLGGYEADKSNPTNRYGFAQGSKASQSWFREIWRKLYVNGQNYSQMFHCNVFAENSSTCQAKRKEWFGFVNSYRYAVRSDVEKLKEMLSVCTNTAFIDTETSIDNFLHIWNQDEHLPSMVKGKPFFQQSYYWTMTDTWLLRKLMSFRVKAFTTSGIIGFWERFCLKHCKKPPEHSELQNLLINSNTITFKPQKLGTNISSLFFILLISFAISILCFLGERFFSPTYECFIVFLSYCTHNYVIR
jgi:hypothetical protein